MILVTVGTHSQPFDRLVKAADNYAESHKNETVIIQKGVSDYKCEAAESFDFCPKDEMSHYIEKADIIVMQGGWGAMQEAIDDGRRIVAVPRIEGVEHIHSGLGHHRRTAHVELAIFRILMILQILFIQDVGDEAGEAGPMIFRERI